MSDSPQKIGTVYRGPHLQPGDGILAVVGWALVAGALWLWLGGGRVLVTWLKGVALW